MNRLDRWIRFRLHNVATMSPCGGDNEAIENKSRFVDVAGVADVAKVKTEKRPSYSSRIFMIPSRHR
jgi:hypothetical protein